MATGAPDVNGIWQYGEDDSNATFSALLNRLGSSTSTQIAADRTRLTTLELPGRVVQVVNGITGTQVQTSTNAWVDTTLTATITPKYASSKILVLVSQNGMMKSADNHYNAINLVLVRNGSIIAGASNLGNTYSNLNLTGISASFSYMDAPATTSAVTYKTSFNNGANASYIRVQNENSSNSTITLIEVKA